MMTHRIRLLTLVLVGCAPGLAAAADPLHVRIDRIIEESAKGKPTSPIVDNAGFLRRVSLDLTGTIPTASAARAFLDDRSSDKRVKLVDRLLASPEYARRMQEAFHVMFLERLGDHPTWTQYLHDSFAANKPWDAMARDMLRGRSDEPAARGASIFLAKRLENYGQNPVDFAGLARDVGRLFLGKDLRCAQCHDHLFVKEYKQADFQGLFVFIQNAYLADPASMLVGEKPLTQKAPFQSVFGKDKLETGPRLPGGKEVAIPKLGKGEEFVSPPDRRTRKPGVLRFSPLAELAREVPANPDFSRNSVNRLWWLLMGRGIVHPLDLHHKDNAPSHPALLDLLAKEFVAHKYDIKWLLREIALTRAYQRSSLLPEGQTKLEPARFLTAIEKRLSAEQMLWSVLEAVGEREKLVAASKNKPAPLKTGKAVPTPLEQARTKFLRAFAGLTREPEEDMPPSLKGALFILNDASVLAWLTPRPGNLVDRLAKVTDHAKLAEELYLSVLTRRPEKDEIDEVAAALAGKTGKDRTQALGRLAWALLASTEFGFNH